MIQNPKKRYTITVSDETYERLLRRKQNPKDSMNDIVKRLLDKDPEGGKRDH